MYHLTADSEVVFFVHKGAKCERTEWRKNGKIAFLDGPFFYVASFLLRISCLCGMCDVTEFVDILRNISHKMFVILDKYLYLCIYNIIAIT